MSRRLPVLLFVAVAAAECALVFVPTVAGAFFVFDDYAHLDAVRSLPMTSFFGAPIVGLFRPLTLLAMKAQFVCFGWAPSGYAAVTALLNLSNAVLFAFVLRSFGENETVRWLAAAFFLVFPPANETHVWFGCQFDLLCVSGFLVYLFLSAAALRDGIVGGKRLLFSSLAGGALLLSLLTKEIALAAPLFLAVLATRRRGLPAIAPLRRVLALAAASMIPLGAFVALRTAAMPLNNSHYGAPLQLFRDAPLLPHLRRYVAAMFSFPYFGASPWAAVFAHGAGLLALVAVLLGLRVAGARGGAGLCAASIAFLAPVLWMDITPGSAVGGRLVYAAALPIALLFGLGAASVVAAVQESSSARDHRTLPVAGALLLGAFFGGAGLSEFSLQRYWGDAFTLARSVMGQIERLPARPNVFVRNLPRQFSNGPYVFKCYAFPIYLATRAGGRPAFRCDAVDVERRGKEIIEAGPRESDVYSSYREARPDELAVELDLQIRRRPEGR
jgi:hypothetical protein